MASQSALPRHDGDIIVPRRRPALWVATAAVAAGALLVLYSFVTNPNYEWATVRRYLFDPRILDGLRMTLMLTVLSMVIALVLGLILAVMRVSDAALLRACAGFYVWFFRGTPVLVQLILWYNLAILLPRIGIGLPGMGYLWSIDTNSAITPWTAALLGLGLNEAAYLAEILRSGIKAVDRGQIDAAKALGMRSILTFRRIVLPQAARIVVPPVFNELVGLLKYSSVVSVIALPELLYSGQLIYARTYETIPVLIVVCIWYLVVVTLLTYVEHRLEAHLGAGFSTTGQSAPSERRWTRWLMPATR